MADLMEIMRQEAAKRHAETQLRNPLGPAYQPRGATNAPTPASVTIPDVLNQVGDIGYAAMRSQGINPFGPDDPNAYMTFVDPRTGAAKTGQMLFGEISPKAKLFTRPGQAGVVKAVDKLGAGPHLILDTGERIAVDPIMGHLPAMAEAIPELKAEIQALRAKGIEPSELQLKGDYGKKYGIIRVGGGPHAGGHSFYADIYHQPSQAAFEALVNDIPPNSRGTWKFFRDKPEKSGTYTEFLADLDKNWNNLPKPTRDLLSAASTPGTAARFGQIPLAPKGKPADVVVQNPDIRRLVDKINKDPEGFNLTSSIPITKKLVQEKGTAIFDTYDFKVLNDALEKARIAQDNGLIRAMAEKIRQSPTSTNLLDANQFAKDMIEKGGPYQEGLDSLLEAIHKGTQEMLAHGRASLEAARKAQINQEMKKNFTVVRNAPPSGWNVRPDPHPGTYSFWNVYDDLGKLVGSSGESEQDAIQLAHKMFKESLKPKKR